MKRVFAFTVLFSILLPLAVIQFPPLNDYPFHLARIAIIDRLPHSAFLQSAYSLNTFLLPNVGMDVIMLALSRMVPIPLAGRIFVALMQLLILSGIVLLNHALFRKVSPGVVLLGGIFLHNWIFLFGFLNYLLATGVLLVGAAVWVYCVDRRLILRLLLGCIFALVIYFSHMLVLGFWAVIIGAFELWRRQMRGLAVLLFTLILPIFLFTQSRTGHEAGSAIRYMPVWWAKPFAFARTFLSANLVVDAVTLIVLAALCALLLWGKSKSVTRLSPAMYLPLAAILALFLVMPLDLFSAQFVDVRIPVLLLFFTIASLRLEWNRAAIAVLMGLLAFRGVMITSDWWRYNAIYSEYTRAFSRMSGQSSLFTATLQPPPSSMREWIAHWQPPTSHIASVAVLDQDVFVAGTWAHPSQQPITVTPRYQPLYDFQSHDPLRFESLEQLASHLAELRASAGSAKSYLLLLSAEHWHRQVPPILSEIASGEHFRLFEIEPPSQGAFTDRAHPIPKLP